MATEHVLSFDEFKRPKSLTGNSATNLRLMRLLLHEPGKSADHPNMGVGIVSRFRYILEDQLNELSTEISQQIATYLPELQGVDITLSLRNKILSITIIADNVMYEYQADGTTLKNLESVV